MVDGEDGSLMMGDYGVPKVIVGMPKVIIGVMGV